MAGTGVCLSGGVALQLTQTLEIQPDCLIRPKTVCVRGDPTNTPNFTRRSTNWNFSVDNYSPIKRDTLFRWRMSVTGGRWMMINYFYHFSPCLLNTRRSANWDSQSVVAESISPTTIRRRTQVQQQSHTSVACIWSVWITCPVQIHLNTRIFVHQPCIISFCFLFKSPSRIFFLFRQYLYLNVWNDIHPYE